MSEPMTGQFKELQVFLKTYLDEELVNDVRLPENLLDPRSAEEIKARYYFIYSKLIGPLCITARDSFNRNLSVTELGFIGERLESYLKNCGF
jgi:hypothetical protein